MTIKDVKVKAVRFHKQVIKELEYLDIKTRQHLTDLSALLAAGESLAMPISRPMPSVAHGTHELRIKDKSGGSTGSFTLPKKGMPFSSFICLRRRRRRRRLKQLQSKKSRLAQNALRR